MPRNSRIEQVTQAFAVQISALIFVRFLEKLGDISTGSLEVRTGASQESYTNPSLGSSSSSSYSDQSSQESSEDEIEDMDIDEKNHENQQALLQIMQWVCTNQYWTI